MNTGFFYFRIYTGAETEKFSLNPRPWDILTVFKFSKCYPMTF